jgi:predicted nuclease with TOPRIM domain
MHDLMDNYESDYRELLKRIRQLEDEKYALEEQNLRLKREVQDLRAKVIRLERMLDIIDSYRY